MHVFKPMIQLKDVDIFVCVLVAILMMKAMQKRKRVYYYPELYRYILRRWALSF